MNATIEWLPYFLAVAETGSFTAAATSLGQTKSRVSRAVSRLEKILDTELFHRTTRAVALTTAGVALFERAAPLFAALREAVGTLPERTEEPSGELRISAPVDLGGPLAEVVARYTLRWPQVRVDMNLTGRRVDLLREGFDLAIRATAGAMVGGPSLIARRLGSTSGSLYASPGYVARRGSPRDVDDETHDWVGFAPTIKSRAISKATPRIRADDLTFIRDVLRGGAGIGWLPSFLAAPCVESGELVPVLGSWRLSQGYFYLVMPSRKRLPAKVTRFRELLLELVRSGRFTA
ncbi:MAG: LysR family transcriptional regulator [Polyangia bacterium]